MTILYAALALGSIAACGAFIATWSLTPAPPTNADLVESRLRAYETGLPVSLVEMELQTPFGERVLRPALVGIAKGGPKPGTAEAPANDNAGAPPQDLG